MRLLRGTPSSKALVDIILWYSSVMSSTVRRALGDISPRWERMQGAILGVRARLTVLSSLAATSIIHLYLVSLTVW